MSKQRLSRRDTIPHSGNNRIRSESPNKTRISCESSQPTERKSRRDIFYSPAVIRSKSTDRRSVKNDQEKEQECSPQSKRLSRRDIFYSPAIVRSKSTDRRRIPTERDIIQEGGDKGSSFDTISVKEIPSGSAAEPVELETQGHRRKQAFRFPTEPCEKDDIGPMRRYNKKYKIHRKQKGRSRHRKRSGKQFACKEPTHTEQQKCVNESPTFPDILEGQDPTLYRHDSNNNAISPRSPMLSGHEAGKASTLPLSKRLRNTFLCSSEPGTIQAISTQDPSGSCIQKARSSLLPSSTGTNNARDGNRLESFDMPMNSTHEVVTDKEKQALLDEYTNNKEVYEQEALLQEYWALNDLWKKSENSANNNAVNHDTENRTTQHVMEAGYSSYRAEEEHVGKPIQHNLNEVKVEHEMIGDTSENSNEISECIGLKNEGKGEHERHMTDTNRDTSKHEVMVESKLVRAKKPVAFVIDMKSDGDKQESNYSSVNESKSQTVDSEAFDKHKIRGPDGHVEDEGISPAKKAIAFVIDTVHAEDLPSRQVKADTALKETKSQYICDEDNQSSIHAHEASNGYTDQQDEMSFVEDAEKKPINKAVAFVIDMTDGENKSLNPANAVLSRRARKQHTLCHKASNVTKESSQEDNHQVITPTNKPKKASVAYEIDFGTVDDKTKRYQETWKAEKSINQTIKKKESQKQLSASLHNEPLPEQMMPTFKMVLQSRRQLQELYNKQKKVSRKAVVTDRRKPFKVNYDQIESKIQTRFPERKNALLNDEERNYGTIDRSLPVKQNYDGVKSKIQTRFPDRCAPATNSAVIKTGLEKGMLPVKQNYDGVKSKIKTRFPDKQTTAVNGSQSTKTPIKGLKPFKEKYDGIKSKIKTRFPDINNVESKVPVIDIASSNRLKPIKQNCGGVKSKIKTRFAERKTNTAPSYNRAKPEKQNYDGVKSKIQTRFPARSKTECSSKVIPAIRSTLNNMNNHQMATVDEMKGCDIKNVSYGKLPQLCKQSTVSNNVLSVTYQRPIAKKVSKLPLSKGMMQKKEKYRLQPNVRHQNKSEQKLPKSSTNASTVFIKNLPVTYQRPIAKTISKLPLSKGMMQKKEKYRLQPNVRHQNKSGQRQRHSVTPRQSPRQPKSPFIETQLTSIIGKGDGKQQFEGDNARNCFSPHRALPPISHREQNITPTSPRLDKKKLSPLRHTPTPPVHAGQYSRDVNGYCSVGKSASSPIPRMNERKLSPLRLTPTPPCLNYPTRVGHYSRVVNGQISETSKSAASPSPRMNQMKLPPIRQTPSPRSSVSPLPS